jgi:hypothetical protein
MNEEDRRASKVKRRRGEATTITAIKWRAVDVKYEWRRVEE